MIHRGDILGINGMMRAILGEAVWRQVEADMEASRQAERPPDPPRKVVSEYEVDGQQYKILDKE